MSDAENTEALAEFQSEFEDLESQADPLRRLTRLDDLGENLGQLLDKIEGLARANYVFLTEIREKAEALKSEWGEKADDARDKVGFHVRNMDNKLKSAGRAVQEGVVAELRDKLDALKGEIADVESALDEHCESYEQRHDEIDRHVYDLTEAIKDRDEASFEFLAGENLYFASDAEWAATGRGGQDPDGVLYLTDKRLIFEQKEKTGKTLGLFGGKKQQGLKWAFDLNHITGVTTENKGMLGGKDMLNISLSPDADMAQVTVEVKRAADNKIWKTMIDRAVGGTL